MSREMKRLENENDIDLALALAEDVFMEFEAPGYPPEGTRSFRNFLYGDRMRDMRLSGDIFFFGAYENEELAGVCALRNKSHIALLFVKGEYHRRGIGSGLFGFARDIAGEIYGTRIFTVNSSSFGLPFYEALGFIPTDMERIEDGVVYTPMIYSRHDISS